MKSLALLHLIGLTLLVSAVAAHAQQPRLSVQPSDLPTLQLVASNAVPALGTFHRLTKLNWPPLPFDNCPGCPVYALGGNAYLIDDTSVDYTAREEETQMAAAVQSALRGLDLDDANPQDAPQYLSFGPDDLWLEVASVSTDAATLVVHSPEADGVYDLFCATELSPTTAWHWIARGLPGQTNFLVAPPPLPQAFFILGTTNGLDTNGLTAAYRGLVGGPETLTNDFDADGLPDAWEIKYFGDLSQGADGNLDGDPFTHLEEYSAGSDPNKISFDVQFDSLWVQGSTASGACVILRGVPSQMAVLVDNTNLSTAQWGPYTGTVLVGLSNEGPHQVWIGLKGRAESSLATWGRWRVTRDTAAPSLTLTNPTSGVLTKPLLQLQGYSPEPLAQLRFDVANAAGLVSNRQGYVTRQVVDTNSLVITTNDFECPDIVLAAGTNLVTVRATDRAGNVSTNFYSYILDYSTATNPVVNLYWPQDAAHLCGTQFTLRGQVDDASSSVTVQILDATGTTNTVSGFVERNGLLWVENVPLGEGTNWVSLAVTNAAGLASVTSLTVVRSPVNLTIQNLTGIDFNQPRITVQCTLDALNYTVWVNGRQAANNLDGTWTANSVPLNTGGTVVIQVRAIPNADHGGAGTGGQGGTVSTLADPGNPTSAQAIDLEADPERQPEVVQTFYFKGLLDQAYRFPDPGEGAAYRDNVKEDILWRSGGEGFWLWDECYGKPTGQYFLWNDANWDTNGSGTRFDGVVRGAGVCGNRTDSTLHDYRAPNQWPGENCSVDATRYLFDGFHFWGDNRARGALTLYELHTGGKSRVQSRNSLFVLSAWAQGIRNPFWPEMDAGSDAYDLPYTDIALGTLGPLGSDGQLYKVLADNYTCDVTPTVRGLRYYSYGQPTLSKHWLTHSTLQRALTNTNMDRTTIGVGEEVAFGFQPPLVMGVGEQPWWQAFAGSVSPDFGSGTWFTAPSNAATAMVRVTVRDAQLNTVFNVVAPIGFAKPPTHLSETVSMSPSQITAGAEMKNWVYIAPTDVSFYRIQVKEGNGSATNRWGYYTNSTLNLQHFNNRWYDVSENNIWSALPDTAEDEITIDQPGTWIAGGYTLHIPVYWTIGAPNGVRDVDPEGTGGPLLPSTLMTHWDQIHGVDNAGKYTITKFNATVSRTIDDHYETSETPNPNP